MTRWRHFLIGIGWSDKPAPARLVIDSRNLRVIELHDGSDREVMTVEVEFQAADDTQVRWFGDLRIDPFNGQHRNRELIAGDRQTIFINALLGEPA